MGVTVKGRGVGTALKPQVGPRESPGQWWGTEDEVTDRILTKHNVHILVFQNIFL